MTIIKIMPANLNDLKAKLKEQIDSAAELERCKYITTGAGQAMTYIQKADEAKRCLADNVILPENYPLLNAEVGITAPTLIEVAEIVYASFSQWQFVGASIESTRLSAKAAINNASTVEEARLASIVTWF